ncbi:MAG TPA: hypothetical protein VHC97_11170 [Thermoanaerobaculia bacterium]|nr:hypothetical protein [Thermoanaerobaculia bacterium]
MNSGPPVTLTLEAFDPEGVGITSIQATTLDNATTSPSLPQTYSAPGPATVTITATKTDQTRSSRIVLLVTTACGASGTCTGGGDPVLTRLAIPVGKIRSADTFADIPAAEHFVTVQNGHPGLRKFQVFVNGQRAALLRMGPGAIQTVDIGAAMTGSGNTITFTGQGRPGASALIAIADVPWRTGAQGSSLIQWNPDSSDADVNLHWGGGAEVM